jgi:transposase InsO family protein
LRTPAPVNKYPEFVRAIVLRLQTLGGHLGKVEIAQVLARAGLHLAASTVGRIRKEPPAREPTPPPVKPMPSARRVVTAKRPNHVWHADLTVVPTRAGMWASWLPFALPQCWPFCWWFAVVVDHYSRKALGYAVFKKQPTSEQVRAFLGRVIAQVGAAPKHLVTDSGAQFTAEAFGASCRRQVFERNRQPEKAIEAYRRGVRISEHDAWPHFYLGRALIEHGQPDQAKAVLEEGNRIEASRYRPRQNVLTALRSLLAMAYLHTDDTKNAERWLSLIAEEDAINPEVARAFAYTRRDLRAGGEREREGLRERTHENLAENVGNEAGPGG